MSTKILLHLNLHRASRAGRSSWRSGGTVIDSTTTDALGNYTFENVSQGACDLTEVPQPKWTQTFPLVSGAPGPWSVNLSANNVGGVDFGNQADPTTISGTKFAGLSNNCVRDGVEPGLGGWIIELVDSSGVAASTTTYPDGSYTFVNVRHGTYTIREVLQPGWVPTFPRSGSYTITLAPADISADNDFGNVRLGSIHGLKFNDVNANGIHDASEPGLNGWFVVAGPLSLTVYPRDSGRPHISSWGLPTP